MMRSLSAWLLVLSFACGEDDPGRPRKDRDPEDQVPSGDDDDDDDDDQAPASPDWSGSWEVELEYSYSCEDIVGTETNSGSGRWSLDLSGPASALQARVNGNDWYTLDGSGDDEGVFLCGSFPIPDLRDEAATSGNDNQLCIDADQVISAEEVRGEMTGYFQDGFGSNCEMDSSPLVLSR